MKTNKYDLDYRPTKKQKQFHQSDADEALYGGAAGGGKSKAIVMEALTRCLEYPNTVAYLFRRTYRELEDTLIAEALASIPNYLGKYKASSHIMHLINDSQIRFRHCNNENDVYQYQGTEMHHLFIDELTHFTEKSYNYLKTRLRVKSSLGFKPIIRATSNPGGRGHAWVKKRFVEPHMQGGSHIIDIYSPLIKKHKVLKIEFIPATVLDNPYLSEDYIFELETKP